MATIAKPTLISFSEVIMWIVRFYTKHKSLLILSLILLLGLFLRCYRIGTLPGEGAVNQDEALAAYEAWSLSQFGTDADGYSNPVYFIAWGSGMNVLASYLMIPFIKLFGLSNTVIRLPHMLIGILSLFSFYCFCRETSGNTRGIAGLFLLSIIPWHIMISRWALESNLLPAFLLFGETFLLKSKEKPALILLSAFFFGLSLYTYSAAWVVLPLLVLFSVLWILHQNPAILRFIPGAFLILLFLALPFFLFLLINHGILPEIRTSWISIPKMRFFRGNEISIHLHVLKERFRELLRILAFQTDGNLWNSFMPFGLYYFVTIPLFAFGIIKMFQSLIESKFHSKEWPVFIWLLCSLLLGILVEPNINRINIIHIPIIYIITIGFHSLLLSKEKDYCRSTIAVLLVCCFSFFYSYESYHSFNFGDQHLNGMGDAVKEVLNCNTVMIADDISYAYPLFYEPVPTPIYLETRKIEKEDEKFRKMNSFGRYRFLSPSDITPDDFQLYNAILVRSGSQADTIRKALGNSPYLEIPYNCVTVFKPIHSDSENGI